MTNEPIKAKIRKPKAKKYPCTICVRVGEEVRTKLDTDAKDLDISVSDVSRGIMEEYYGQEEEKRNEPLGKNKT